MMVQVLATFELSEPVKDIDMFDDWEDNGEVDADFRYAKD